VIPVITISKFSIHRTSVTAATVFALSTLLFLIPMWIMTMLASGTVEGSDMPAGFMAMMFVMPLFYWIFGYLGTATSCWIYNRIAKKSGGITFDFLEVESGGQGEEPDSVVA